MKNVVWVLVALAGFFTSCQTGKLYSGTVGWGDYNNSAEANSAAYTMAEAGPGTASASLTVAVANNEDSVYYAVEPVLFARSEVQQVTFVKRPKTPVSLAQEENKTAPQPQHLSQPREMHKLAVAGLATSVLAFLPFVLGISLFFSLPLALAGAWMSRRAIKQISADRDNFRGLALAKAGFGIAVIMLGLLLLFGAAALAVG